MWFHSFAFFLAILCSYLSEPPNMNNFQEKGKEYFFWTFLVCFMPLSWIDVHFTFSDFNLGTAPLTLSDSI